MSTIPPHSARSVRSSQTTSRPASGLTGLNADKMSSGVYPAIRQRGFYSDIVTVDAQDCLSDIRSGPPTAVHSVLGEVVQQKHTPLASSYRPARPAATDLLSPNANEDQPPHAMSSTMLHGPNSCLTHISDFPPDSYMPKVCFDHCIMRG